MLCGVCAGLAKYLGVDVSLVRLIWAAFALFGGGILLYIIAAVILPQEPWDGTYDGSSMYQG